MQVKNICTFAGVSLLLCFVSPLGSFSLPTSNNSTTSRKNGWSKPWKRRILSAAQKYPLPEPSAAELEKITEQIQELPFPYDGNHSFISTPVQQSYFPPLILKEEKKVWKNDFWKAVAAYRPKDVIEITFRVFAGILFFWTYVLTPAFDFLKQITESKTHVGYSRYSDYGVGGYRSDYDPETAARLAILDYSSDPPVYFGFGRDYCMQRIACEILDWTSTLRGTGTETVNHPRNFEHYNFTTGWAPYFAEREGCAKFPCRPVQSLMRFLLYTLDWNTILKATF